MDGQTPTASVTPETFTMADALRQAAEQSGAPAVLATEPAQETIVTDDTQATKPEESATPPKQETPEEPPLLRDTEDTETELDIDNLNFDEVLKDVTDDKRKEAHKKGLEKLVDKLQNARKEWETKTAEIEHLETRLEPVLTYLNAFAKPDEWQAAYEQLGVELAKQHGNFSQAQQGFKAPQPQTNTPVGNEDQLVEAESWAETKERWKRDFMNDVREVFKGDIEGLKEFFKGELGSVSEWQKAEQAKVALNSKLEQAYPTVHGNFPFATKEMLQAAITKYPDLDPMAAFSAAHVKEIARYYAEYGKNLAAKPSGPQITNRDNQPSLNGQERPTTMAGIREELQIF